MSQTNQMSQTSTGAAGREAGERRPDLKQHYKPVGIQAITAAALCKSPEAGDKPPKPLAPPRG
jgi:hypothetical protein